METNDETDLASVQHAIRNLEMQACGKTQIIEQVIGKLAVCLPENVQRNTGATMATNFMDDQNGMLIQAMAIVGESYSPVELAEWLTTEQPKLGISPIGCLKAGLTDELLALVRGLDEGIHA